MNIEKTKKLDLCVSCEACSAVCSQNAIKMVSKKGQYLPDIDLKKCTNCGICKKVCPGINFGCDFADDKNFSVEKVAGKHMKSYIASYRDKEIRKIGTSGGVTTGLLIEMLRAGDIDGAFVLKSEGANGKIARIELVESVDEILSGAKSKYIPASVFEVIKKIKSNPEKKYAIAGTSCQFIAIKKALEIFDISEEKIFFLGLFCDRTLNYNILKYFNNIIGCKKDEIAKVDFRNKEKRGWPGDLKICSKKGKEFFLDRKKRMEVKEFFQLNRCLFCFDKLNRNADISFGDCYVKGEESKEGKNNIIIRTEKGFRIFEKFRDKFEIKEMALKEILNSQKLEKKAENFKRMKEFPESNRFSYKRIRIFIGARYPFTRFLIKIDKFIENFLIFLRINLRRTEVLVRLLIVSFNIFIEVFNHICSYFFGKFSPQKNKKLEKVIIFGGGMGNKGAQAMTFTVVDQIKRKNANCEIFLLLSGGFNLSEEEINRYNFKIIPWGLYDRLEIFYKGRISKKHSSNLRYRNEIRKTLSSADCIFDTSGYALSSQRGVSSSILYMLNLIIAKKFFIPVYLLPQSFGPYSYKFPINLIANIFLNLYLKYPTKIFAREEDGYKKTLSFTNKNIEKSLDLVIQNKGYIPENIFSKNFSPRRIDIKSNSVGMVPNLQVTKKMKWSMEDFYELYRDVVSELVSKNKNVYIIEHSSEDDEISKKIKNFFPLDNRVNIISGNFNAIELEYIINQMDFIVASRYHSIIHAYKNGIPAIVIGWAVKYKELLEAFDQQKYMFDCREDFKKEDIIKKISEMISNHSTEKEKICLKTEEIMNNSIYNKIF